jgi:hypothetical protein
MSDAKSKWVRFREVPAELVSRRSKLKTKVWDIISREAGFEVGQVSWFASWRQYVFVPRLREEDEFMSYDVFNPECLRNIADFAETRTKEHRAARAALGEQR